MAKNDLSSTGRSPVVSERVANRSQAVIDAQMQRLREARLLRQAFGAEREEVPPDDVEAE